MLTKLQIKAIGKYQKSRAFYLAYANQNLNHVNNESKPAKELHAAEDNLIISFFGNDSMWIEHSYRSSALRISLEKSGLDTAL